MKAMWKRLVAFMLTLCMLLSVMPPMVIAVESTPSQKVTYNFHLDNDPSFEVSSGVGFADKSLSNASSGAQTAIKNYYDNGTLNWHFFHSNCTAAVFGNGTNWDGIRFRAAKTGAEYLALKIKSPGAGTFDLTLSYQQQSTGTTGQMYILPGDTASGNILTAVAAATPVISYDAQNATKQNTTSAGSFTFEADAVYTLVFYTEQNNHAYLLSLDAEPVQAPPQETTAPQSVTMDYNFHLDNDPDFTLADGVTGFADKSLSNASSGAQAAIRSYYDSGALNWYYFHSNCTAAVFGNGTNWDGIRFRAAKTGAEYLALKIKSPGTGTFDLTLNYQQQSTGTTGQMYILPGDTASGDILTAVAATTPVISYDAQNATKQNTTSAGSFTFEADAIYTLVFYTEQNNHAYLLSLHAEGVVSAPQETTSPEETTVSEETTAPIEPHPPVQLDSTAYNFAEVSSVYGSFGDSNTTLNAMYANGEIRWTYAGKSANNQATVMGGVNSPSAWSGMRWAAKANNTGWVAYRIASPGTGSYEVTVGYQTNKVLGKASVYLLPGATTDIEAALASATAMGEYNGYVNSTAYTDASVKLTSKADFVAGEEYIFVFRIVNDTAKNIYATVNSVSVNLPGAAPVVPTPPQPTPPTPVEVPKLQLDKAEYAFDSVEAVKGTSFGNRNDILNKLYNEGQLLWTFAGKSGNNQATVMGGTNPETQKTTGAWSGMRFAAKPGGGWVAYRIVAPGTGNYTLTVDYQINKALGNTAVYVLPGDTTDIDAALQTAAQLGTYSCYDNGDTYVDTSKTFKQTAAFESGKEYLLVFYVPNNNVKGNIYATVNGVTLNIAAEEVKQEQTLDQMIYDFDLGHSDLKFKDKSFANLNVTHASVDKTVEGFYYDGIVNWNYRGGTPDMYMIAGFGGVAADKEYAWNGLCMYARNDETKKPYYNFWYAFNIRSPGTGEYKLTLDYGVHTNGAAQGSIYILPADTADIGAAIAAGKAIGTVNYDNGAANSADAAVPGRSTYGNAISMEAGKEYILVFTSDAVGRANARLYVDSVTLTKAGVATPADIIPYRKPQPKPIPAGSTVYDLDLRDPVHGIYTGNKLIGAVEEELHQRYSQGIDNWDYVDQKGNAADDTVFHRHGLTIYAKEMDWLAIKIKAPKAGLYSVGLNYAISGNGGTTAVYVLPADTVDIDTALDPSCRIGLMSFTLDTGITTPDDGHQTFVGTWEFGDEEEYIIVFEGYKRSPFPDDRAYMMISQLFMTPGDVIEEAEEEKTINAVVVDPGPVKLLGGTYYGTTQNINGCDYLYMPIEGKKMLIFDLDNNVIAGEVEIPFTMNRGITVDENGIVWLCGDKAQLFRYDPFTGLGESTKLYKKEAPDASSGYWTEYADGCVYFGTYPSGCIMKYEIATDTFTNLGSYSNDISYANGVLYKDGFIYSGMNGDKNGDGKKTWVAVKMDAKTGEVVGYTDLYDMVDPDRTSIYGAGFAGDLLLIGGESTQNKFIAIDINTMELVDLGVNGGISYSVTEEIDGKVYFVLNGMGLHSMDVATREVKAVPGFKDANIPVRCSKYSFVDVDDPLYPGPSIVTYSTGQGVPRIYNLEKGAIKTYHEAVDPEYGNPTSARALINGLPGSNEILMGGYNTHHCAVFNTVTGISENFEAVSDQTDVMLYYKDVLYSGNYAAGCVARLNREDKARNQVLLTLNDDIYDQARVHTLAAGDDMLFAGSTPDKFLYGGCLAIIDLNTLERYVERNVVQDQSINCLVYHDGYIYGSTSIYGGTGTAVRDDLSAKIFVYDVAKREKIGEFDLRDYISGFDGNIKFISGIAADPNVAENGRFWGLVSETLFTFSYDKETGKFTAKEEISYDKNTYNATNNKHWFPRPFRFDDNGNLYVSFESNGGLRRINTENTQDHERVMPYTPIHYVLGEDGNLYYLKSYSLCMYPLNVTEEDWAKADAVDQKILAIGDKITLDSEEKILAAREAYNALDVKDKALVQKLYLLEEAEADLLELQIAEIPETITTEHQALLLGLQEKYDAMSTNQQRFVKNYDVLKAARNELKVLLDKEAAAQVQEMIDSIKDLGELTLEHKDRIAEIRSAYDALTSYQKAYVDATALLDAEAIMAVLRAQEIERLKQLIASIGEVTLEDEAVIVEADGIFSWLTLEERQQVDGAALSSAKIQLTKLQKEAAGKVDALIGKIGKVGLFSGSSISKARKAYNALTEGSKAYVTLIDTLIAAEKAFKPIAIALWCVGGVVVAGGGAATVIVLKKKRKAVPAKEPETAE